MIKRIISMMLTLCMVLMFVPTTAFAESSEPFTYTVSETNEVTITGYTGSESDVNIPDEIDGHPVTAIGDFAFDNCYNLKSVTFGADSKLQSIGNYAFSRCQLTSIIIPENVTSIGCNAFFGCEFTRIIIPRNVEFIDRTAFSGCRNLISIDVNKDNLNYSSMYGVLLHNKGTELIQYPLGNKNTSYEIERSVRIIGKEAFRGCDYLMKVIFPSDSRLASIEEYAFCDCDNLTEINIPNSVTSIAEGAFYMCDNLKSINIPNDVTAINDRTFTFCNNLESIFMADKVSCIGVAAIPDTASQVKYNIETDKNHLLIMEINLGTGKTSVAIPTKIFGYCVASVKKSEQPKVGAHACTSETYCFICGKENGEINSSNHNLKKILVEDPTDTETGNKEIWYCLDCGKYFADENGTTEIKPDNTVTQELPPAIIEGTGQSITTGEKAELTFRSNAAFDDFIRVELDGKELDEKYYNVKEGSTIVTLKADYVATLSAGKHTIGIVSKSGTAEATFTVNAKTAVVKAPNSPQTGDATNLVLWIALMLISGILLSVLGIYGKKKKHNR